MSTRIQGRKFNIVLNGVERFDELIANLKGYKGLNALYAYLETAPSTGHQHIHIFAYYSAPVKIALKKLCGAHIETAKGSIEQNIMYVTMEGDPIIDWHAEELSNELEDKKESDANASEKPEVYYGWNEKTRRVDVVEGCRLHAICCGRDEPLKITFSKGKVQLDGNPTANTVIITPFEAKDVCFDMLKLFLCHSCFDINTTEGRVLLHYSRIYICANHGWRSKWPTKILQLIEACIDYTHFFYSSMSIRPGPWDTPNLEGLEPWPEEPESW